MQHKYLIHWAALLWLGATLGCGAVGENNFTERVLEASSSAATTQSARHSAPLTVTLTTPNDGAMGVPIDQIIGLTFSAPIGNGAGLLLRGPQGTVATTRATTGDGSTWTLTPTAPLAAGVTYQVVALGHDLPLGQSHSWRFTTAINATEPTLVPLVPTFDGDGWSVGVQVDSHGNDTMVGVGLRAAGTPTLMPIKRPSSLFSAPRPLTAHRQHDATIAVGGGRTHHYTVAVGWANVTPPGSAALNAVAMTSRHNGVAVGENGAIFGSRDGGSSWRAVASPTTAHLRAIGFSSPWEGWIVGDRGTALHTVDGDRWEVVALPTRADLTSITFLDPLTGWLIGSGGTLLETVDGGRNWTRIPDLPAHTLNGLVCDATRRCLAVGDVGTVLVRTDGAWRVAPITTRANLMQPALGRHNESWIVGEGGILLTGGFDSGWVVRGAAGIPAFMGLDFADGGDTGLAVGSAAFVLITDDGGISWQNQALPGDYDLNGVAASGSGHMIAVGRDPLSGLGVLLKSDTGGRG